MTRGQRHVRYRRSDELSTRLRWTVNPSGTITYEYGSVARQFYRRKDGIGFARYVLWSGDIMTVGKAERKKKKRDVEKHHEYKNWSSFVGFLQQQIYLVTVHASSTGSLGPRYGGGAQCGIGAEDSLTLTHTAVHRAQEQRWGLVRRRKQRS